MWCFDPNLIVCTRIKLLLNTAIGVVLQRPIRSSTHSEFTRLGGVIHATKTEESMGKRAYKRIIRARIFLVLGN